MARPRLTESARVSIALKVSQVDAARIDEVLTRPEFAGWTRAEWCREIIRTALRYYVGDAPAPDPGQARVPARPAAAQPVPPEPAPARAQAVDANVRGGEPLAGGSVQLPEERNGLVFVFRVFEKMSYAMVMRATKPIYIGDIVQTP